MKREYSPQFSKKYSNIKFPENTSSGSRVVPYGDRHDEAKSRSENLRTHLKST